MKPIVRMSRRMKLVINNTEITFVLPDPNVDTERLAAAGDARVTGAWRDSQLARLPTPL